MNVSGVVKTILFSAVYGINLLLAFCLWLCGLDGNIMLGIIFIVLYRLSLWSTPFVVTLLCWMPWRPKETVKKKLIFNFIHLLCCGVLFLICFLLFGNWY